MFFLVLVADSYIPCFILLLLPNVSRCFIRCPLWCLQLLDRCPWSRMCPWHRRCYRMDYTDCHFRAAPRRDRDGTRRIIPISTLPKTNISPVQMAVFNRNLRDSRGPQFSGAFAVSFRESKWWIHFICMVGKSPHFICMVGKSPKYCCYQMASKMAAYKWGTPIRTTFWFTVPRFYRHWWCRDRAMRLVNFVSKKIPKSGYRGTNGTIGIDLPILGWLEKNGWVPPFQQ